MNPQKRHYFSYPLFILISIFTFAPAAGAETLLLGGYSGNDDSDHYGYIGAIIPMWGSTLANDGWRLRFWADYLSFTYDGTLAGGATGTPTEFEGDGPGVQGALGYQWSYSSTGKSTTYIGLQWHDIDVDPADPANDTEDEDLSVKIQEEITQQLTSNIDVSLIGSYAPSYKDYWARLRPGYALGNGWKVGPEVIIYGGDEFTKQRYGAFLGGIKLGNLGIGFSLGLEEESSTDDDAFYGTISLSTVF